MVGIVSTPQIAGSMRMVTYGTLGSIVFADVLEVEVSVKSTQPSCQCDEELREWRMDVHEESALDVFRCESTEAGISQPTCLLSLLYSDHTY